jgi:nicotinate-nucleotide pyrophosphorylase (carboxylating)
MKLLREIIQPIVHTALAEDIGAGDITTLACVPFSATARAHIIAKEPLVVAGLPVVNEVFRQLDGNLSVKSQVSDGFFAKKGEILCEISGNAAKILTGERVALNFLQRLSGIATLTKRFVDAVSGTNCVILDTRKTTPTLRALEKYAVRVGGGQNHRAGLFDQVLVKDNHHKILQKRGASALREAVAEARKLHPDVKIEIEAATTEQIVAALDAGADVILLDNMSVSELRDAVKFIGGRAKTEASGGVTLENVRAIAETGVDFISVGALTHSGRAVDVSLEIIG